MNLRLLLFFYVLFLSANVSADITVSVDRNPVVADESFKLVFESNEKVKGQPDFSPLNKDLTILSTGRRSNTQIVNGDIKRSQQWVLTAIANKTGIIQIPPINFGNVSSKATQIKVVASAPSNPGNVSEDIFIDVNVDKKTPYVQEQIIYTLKLYRAVQTSNATLSEPKINGDQAVISKLGEDKSFDATVKGKRYVVIQRQYAIFPQSSGALKIEPIIFQAETGPNRMFGFDPFGPQPKAIVKRSDSIILDIKPIPDSFTGDTWLPASQLSIQEQWSIDPAELKQGEATTRTLSITANGLAASHLPMIENDLPDYLKQYPDQPELQEEFDEKGFIGIRKEKMAIIPAKSGEFKLAAIKIPWWNTQSDKMEFAELPERTIYVHASELIENELKQQQSVNNNENLVGTGQEIAKQVFVQDKIPTGNAYWKWISAVLLLCWLSTLFILYKTSKSKKLESKKNYHAESSINTCLRKIKKACESNNPTETKEALLNWANIMWQDEKINSLNAIKKFSNDAFQKKLDDLNNQLYGQKQQTWDGKTFYQSFQSQSFEIKKGIEIKGNLEPLYKT